MEAANAELSASKAKVEGVEEEFEMLSANKVKLKEIEEEGEEVYEENENKIEEEIKDDGSDGGGEQRAVESEQPPEKRIGSVDSKEQDKRQHYSASSPGKIFVGGIAWDTTEKEFFNHFAKYGEITDSVIMKDKHTWAPRGFGFVTFADPSIIDTILGDEHSIGGRMVEVKRTVPKGGPKSKKIFVGGIPASLTEDEFKEHFSSYGVVVEHQIMVDHSTGRSRGFGFISFESEEPVEKIISEGRMHDLAGKLVEIKKAEPKKGDVGFEGRGSGSYGYGGGSHGYGGGPRPMGNYQRGRDGTVSGDGFYGRGNCFGGAAGYGGRAAGFFPGYGRPLYGFGGGYDNSDFYGSGSGYAPAGGYGAVYSDYASGRGYGNRYHPYGR
ncbi:Heterogeneous nuclear ribonucleoprotein 1 [Platanthera guangdongensis]|uniref:Heterogeneous nuclear ribonucleoprotein 1 n=1 Tax=Platanthera guangdongensis TaxID=2320717 RepID=A0ABR2N185_9ASPA